MSKSWKGNVKHRNNANEMLKLKHTFAEEALQYILTLEYIQKTKDRNRIYEPVQRSPKRNFKKTAITRYEEEKIMRLHDPLQEEVDLL